MPWVLFQLTAVVLGGLLVLREGGHRLVAPYALGVLLSIAGAVALGSGGAWAAWLSGPRTGPAPELEIAGFGALFGLLAGHVVGARARGVSAARALDVLAPSIGAMIAVARVGCFFAGCDFGRPTALPWGVRYPAMTPAFRGQLEARLIESSASQTLPVHPTQLYEACLGLLVLVLALRVRSPRRDGDRFVLAACVYAVGRMVIDVFRGDLARGGALGMTVTQGLALALVGLVIAWRGARGRLRQPGCGPRARHPPRNRA
jgi:prolipoprotein diacylglyceryltransferase